MSFPLLLPSHHHLLPLLHPPPHNPRPPPNPTLTNPKTPATQSTSPSPPTGNSSSRATPAGTSVSGTSRRARCTTRSGPGRGRSRACSGMRRRRVGLRRRGWRGWLSIGIRIVPRSLSLEVGMGGVGAVSRCWNAGMSDFAMVSPGSLMQLSICLLQCVSRYATPQSHPLLNSHVSTVLAPHPSPTPSYSFPPALFPTSHTTPSKTHFIQPLPQEPQPRSPFSLHHLLEFRKRDPPRSAAFPVLGFEKVQSPPEFQGCGIRSLWGRC